MSNEKYLKEYYSDWGPTKGQVEWLPWSEWRPPKKRYMELTYCAILTELTMCWFDDHVGQTMTMRDYLKLMYLAEHEHAKGHGWIHKSKISTIETNERKDYQNHHTPAKVADKYGTLSQKQATTIEQQDTQSSSDSLNTDAMISGVQTALKGV